MATATYEESDDRGTTSTRRSSGGSRGRDTLRTAASSLNTAALFEIVERLGVVDMVIERVKGRLEEVDIDDLLDQVGDYLKRNPEVLVVSLGAITIATGALVYLNKRNEEERTPRRTSSGGGSSSSSSSSGGGSTGGSRKSGSRSSSSR